MSVGVVHHRWDLPLIGQSSVVLSDATAANCDGDGDGDATAAKHQLGHRYFSLDPQTHSSDSLPSSVSEDVGATELSLGENLLNEIGLDTIM